MLKDWIPPVLLKKLRNIRSNGITFSGSYNSWDAAATLCSGYDEDNIIEKVLESALKVKNDEAVYERDSVIFDKIQYSWPVLSALMWVAAQNGGRLNVLDFGGALGGSYFENRVFLNSLQNVSWSVVEQEHFVEAGKTYFQNDRLNFYKTIEDCMSDNLPNIILLSSVLQYISDPGEIIGILKSIGSDVIVIDRTIVNYTNGNRIYVQHVPKSIYSASYPCYSLSESWLFNQIGNNYELSAEFSSLNFSALIHINSVFKGYIFKIRI